MNTLKYSMLAIAMLVSTFIIAQNKHTDANIIGHVVDANGDHIPYASVILKNTKIGTITDATGHYSMVNLPIGKYTIQAKYQGFKTAEIPVEAKVDTTIEIKFQLEEDVLGLDEVVITGNKNKTSRKESTVVVSTLPANIFSKTQSANLSEGLNFCTGLRTENNCQNCGFNQVRVNGMEGPYSQILINGYPIFSGLAGVYGLELIPQNMIEKIEVVRGGGSALYGSNAVAGTINILLKEPHFNTYEAGISSGINGFGISDTDQTGDHTINFNTSLVGNDISYALYGFYRNREAFDANGDDFSELANLENMTLGNHLNYNITDKAKLTTDLFFIKEDRRGGNKFDMPNHMADISEALNHTLLTGAIKFEQDFNYSDWSLYASGQNVDRDSYYGAEQSLSDYGKTEGLTYVLGTQYNYSKDNYLLTLGYEYNYDDLKDQKLGYYDIENDEYLDNTLVADQKKTTHGVFAQAEYTLNKFKFTAGARLENYSILEEEHDKNMSETLLVPRFVLKYDINNNFQWRASYAQGYRPPQIFDEDLHIETSGSRQIIHENDPDLTKELSHSIMTSFDYNKQFNKAYFSFLVEGFYTRLDNAFANEIGEPDEDGTVIYTRVNAKEGAVVYGANIESNYIPSDKLSFKLGFTVQRSEYEEAQDFEEKAFFRTPNAYGFLMADIDMGKGFGLNTSMNYTGSMLVPHYDEVLVETDGFLDWGIKLDYDWAIKNETHLNLYTGVKNILNSYQDDFDTGIDRDPAYIYGPGNPRMIYFGLKIGNNLL